jgi:hypothetical protein
VGLPNFKLPILIDLSTSSCIGRSYILIFGYCDKVTPHMAVDSDRRAKKIASRLEHALLLRPVTTAMSFDPTDRNPEVSAYVTDNNSTESPVDQSQSKPSLTGQESITQSHPQSSKKRRPSKSKVPSELRRSSSTPHMRSLALGNSGELSPTSNKPRNKLGYHRTSVACGKRQKHCFLRDY